MSKMTECCEHRSECGRIPHHPFVRVFVSTYCVPDPAHPFSRVNSLQSWQSLRIGSGVMWVYQSGSSWEKETTQ